MILEEVRTRLGLKPGARFVVGRGMSSPSRP